MHSVVWASVLASAAVAAVTTLIIEYLAKPWLDARKDRIIEDDRQKRAAIKAIKRSIFLMASLHTFEDDKEHTVSYAARIRSNAAEIEKALIDAYQVINVPQSVLPEWIAAAGVVVGFAMAFQDKEGAPSSNFKLASDRLNIFIKLLEVRRFHILHRRKLIQELKALAPTALARQTSPEP
jgi:hypothetical protein